MVKRIDLDCSQILSYYSEFGTQNSMFQSLWKTFLVMSLLIPSIWNLQLLMKTGPVLLFFPMLILRTLPSSRVSCLVLM